MLKTLIVSFIFVTGFIVWVFYSNINNPNLIPAFIVLIISVGGTTLLFWHEFNKKPSEQPNRREVDS